MTEYPATKKGAGAVRLALALPIFVLLIAPAARAAEARRSDLHMRLLKLYRERGQEIGYRYELRESSEAPGWARAEGEPLFRFVHLTDIHHSPRRRDLLVRALAFISDEVKPAFTVITGDNAGSSDLDAQRAFKQLLDEGLSAPYFILRGDNWPQGFTEVFGPADWSFRVGGMAFVGASIDRDVLDAGIGVFDAETFLWLVGRLDANRDRPLVYFQHVNLVPATFLDAPRLLGQFEARGNVVATVTGHLHRDHETARLGIVHIVGPAFGPHRDHPFKVFRVYPDHITVRTAKFRDGRFRYVNVYQRVAFPERTRLAPPADPEDRARWLSIAQYDAPPPREIVFDPTLALRCGELLPHAAQFLIETGRAGELWADLIDVMVDAVGVVSAATRPSDEE